MATEFHPNHIQRLVFDLNSLAGTFGSEGWQNFQSFIKVLDERAYETVLIGEECEIQDWQAYSNVSVLVGSTQNLLEKNRELGHGTVFWITEDSGTQERLSGRKQAFAGGNESAGQNGGIQYQYLFDLLEIFHPSRATARELANTIQHLKQESPRMPLTLGIGGPDDCGHAFFVGELVEVLEAQNMLVAGLDLSELMGLEFENHAAPTTYWRSQWFRDWVLDQVLHPYSRGEEVILESAPEPLIPFEITPFPFYLSPEMVLLIWGTTLFLQECEQSIDVRILLDLSPKAAAARMFNLDERENFDPSFIHSYESSEGESYRQYLQRFQVEDKADFRINFDNFNAFRLTAGPEHQNPRKR